MKKTLILTVLSFGLFTHAIHARVPDLTEYGYNTSREAISGSSHIIRFAATNKSITLANGKTYIIDINDRNFEKLTRIKEGFEGFKNRAVTQALRDQTLHLDRDGINFTLSNNSGISADFRIGTEEQLADARALTDAQHSDISIEKENDAIALNPFQNVNDYQKSRIYSALLSDNEMTDPYVINLALFEAHKLEEIYKRYVYAAYLRRNTVKRSLRAIIFEEAQNFTENEKVFIYKALIERVKPDSETAMTILTEARNFTKGNKATIYVAYIKQGKAEKERVEQMMKETETFDGMYRSWIYAAYIERKDTELDQANAIIERAKDFNKWQQKDIYKAYIARKDADPQIIEKNDMERIVR